MTFARGGKELPTLADFTFMKVVGRGSFGKVMLVKKKGSDEPFAMKILNKQVVERRNQKIHTQSNLFINFKLSEMYLPRLILISLLSFIMLSRQIQSYISSWNIFQEVSSSFI